MKVTTMEMVTIRVVSSITWFIYVFRDVDLRCRPRGRRVEEEGVGR